RQSIAYLKVKGRFGLNRLSFLYHLKPFLHDDLETLVYSPFAALPVLFKSSLKDLESEAGENAVFRCELDKAGAKVIWRKDKSVLSDGKKYSIKRDGTIQTLEIHKLSVDDGGEYICEAGDKQSKATLTVKGNNLDSSLEMGSILHCFPAEAKVHISI
uniref:Ig-like domain-containing protein n=1 Tax=Sinocyclocheilus rhinocerous TaxID=307959 RepID=A0A673M1S2_9TELE